ncbi:hypothetical protein LOZ55_006330 [Ophidiomyces ophidiicola]|nr:hypothetical protein LOZ55_006330 [Ophidiomyces ophidiicola]
MYAHDALNRDHSGLNISTCVKEPSPSTSLIASTRCAVPPPTRLSSSSQSPKECDTRTSLSHLSQEVPLRIQRAAHDLRKPCALHDPRISLEEWLSPSTTITTPYVPASSTVSIQSTHTRHPSTSWVSPASTAISLKRSSLPTAFAPPPPQRPAIRPSRLSRSSLPLSPNLSAAVISNNDFTSSTPDSSLNPSCQILDRFEGLINAIDRQSFSGRENDLVMNIHTQKRPSPSKQYFFSKDKLSKHAGLPTKTHQINFSSTVYNYENSRLPSDILPLRVTFSIWPMLYLAAQFSQRAYNMPSEAEKETFVEAEVRGGTNAMVIKSVVLEHMDLIVLSIRGTNYTVFKQWASEMTLELESPMGFLDDPETLCHPGFLGMARHMVKPVALRLQQILKENPSLSAASLIITGHSTGGAIASLLYLHMLSRTIKSELTAIRQVFDRIHCISFGAPPVSSQPLHKPTARSFENCLFFSIANEGDPVTLAERSYIHSLINLYRSPIPAIRTNNFVLRKLKIFSSRDQEKSNINKSTSGSWCKPTPTLSLPGRLVLLRGSTSKSGKETAQAHLTTNEELASVVFGDVKMHSMTLYQKRVEILAAEAAQVKLEHGSRA